MTWARMRFRDQIVWVRTGADGRPVLDGDGRAEMKYRESDEKSYRPSPSNLSTVSDKEAAVPDKPRRPRAALPGKSRSAPKALPSIEADAASAIHVWTDGACTGNPGPMGIGMVVIHGDKRVERGEYLGTGTNNIAELTAIERGLELAEEMVPDLDKPILVYTDSQYSIGVLSLGWKAKANQELVGGLRERLGELDKVRFVKVAGHAGIPENERCDELARAAITRRSTVTR